uniref:BHLH domain-containing protein n=1 Tax=Globodera rostochiensis TaxID=31243 RepID=A0A914H1Z8_GLORO
MDAKKADVGGAWGRASHQTDSPLHLPNYQLMQQPPPVHPSGVPSSSVLLDHQQQQLAPLQYHYALQQPQHQGTPFPLIPSSAADPPNSVSSSSASVCPLPAQFQHLYPLGGSNFTDTGQQQQQSSTAFTTMPPHSLEISETVKTEQQKKQPNGTTSKAEQRNNGDEIGKKIAEEKGRIEFPYGPNGIPFGGMFGAISTDYGGWMGTAAGHGLVTSYPVPSSVPHQMAPPPPCPIPLVADDLSVMYGSNGLMNLNYEIDQTMGGYEGVWTGGGYYLGADRAKLLSDPQQYLNGAADTVDGRYGGGNGGGSTSGCANGPNSFYSSLHQQGISPSALVDPSLFHPNSVLPPAPSQLTTDPLYGQAGTFSSLGVPSAHAQAPLPPALSSSESAAVSSNALFTPSRDGPPALLQQLDPASIQQHSNFYPSQFGENVPPLSSSHSSDSTSTNLGKHSVVGLAKKGGQQNNRNASLAIRQNSAAKRGRLSKTAGGGASSTVVGTGRPSSSQATEREQRTMGGEGCSGGRKMNRSRSVAKDSSDDDKSTEEKEQDRRNANNTRERIRVRDINAAFKELARLCSQHMPNVDERGLTKLNTLLKAVELIPLLEKKVEEKNSMNGRKETVRHRLNGPPTCPLPATAQLQSHPFGPSADPSALLGQSMAIHPNTTANLTSLQGGHG